jgi:hypothetical protein
MKYAVPILVISWLAILSCCVGGCFFVASRSPARQPAQAKQTQEPLASDKAQHDRRKAIDIYVKAGLIVAERKNGTTPHISVDPIIWKQMAFSDKENLAAVLAAWYYKTQSVPRKGTISTREMVVFYDFTTDEEIATFFPIKGLKLKH